MMRRARVDRKPTLSKLKREADRVFSLWIRRRNPFCVQCGSRENLTCGHLISRRILNLRWEEWNCWTQCWPCNYRHKYQPQHYTAWFIGSHGLERYTWLVSESKVVKQFKRHDIEQIIERYK